MSRVVHFEIHAENPDRAAKFYTDVFGWEIKKWEGSPVEYWMVMTGDKKTLGIDGGITRRLGPAPTDGQPVNAYTCVMEVKDIDAIIALIEKAGGKLALAKNDVPGVGALAYYKDTEGNIFGILQPLQGMSM